MSENLSIIRWFEIPATDFERAVKFYSEVLDLKIEVKSFNGIAHGVFSTGKGSISGTIVKTESVNTSNSGPVIYFRVVFDMNEMLRKIESLGGKILLPKTLIKNTLTSGGSMIPKNAIDNQIGYYALFLDCEGNKMALYSNS